MLKTIGFIFIGAGILLILFAVYDCFKRGTLKKIREYRTLMQAKQSDSFEYQPIERVDFYNHGSFVPDPEDFPEPYHEAEKEETNDTAAQEQEEIFQENTDDRNTEIIRLAEEKVRARKDRETSDTAALHIEETIILQYEQESGEDEIIVNEYDEEGTLGAAGKEEGEEGTVVLQMFESSVTGDETTTLLEKQKGEKQEEEETLILQGNEEKTESL